MLGGILLVLATSLDGFSAGVAYGLRKIQVPWPNRALVAAVSVLAMAAAMQMGRLMGSIFPAAWARTLGGCLLIVLGLWTAVKSIVSGPGRRRERVWSWRLPSLGLVVQILRQPVEADLDASGEISMGEALWLGFALSLDAFAAGFCASLGARLPLLLPVAVGAVNWLFLTAGITAGGLLRREKLPLLAVAPGLILAVLGLLRLI